MTAVFRRIDGRNGRIEVPEIGAHIGSFTSWTLTRRGETGPESDLFDLHAVCSFVQGALFDDKAYDKMVIVQPGRGRAYRLVPIEGPGQRTVLSGRSLTMERVAIQHADQDRNRTG